MPMKTKELLSHLETKAKERKNSKTHYERLAMKVAAIDDKLTAIHKKTEKLEENQDVLIANFKAIEDAAVQLKRQAPYTLFWMRAVEIGLPLLLSMISAFLALRYPLTEERCYAIKAALKERNEKRAVSN